MSPYCALLTPDQLEDWMQVRFGAPGGMPIYWHASGLARDALSGEALYTFEYYDVSRQIRDPDRPDIKLGVARKFDAFRDKETNTLIDSVDGQKVGALLYPYQMFAYQVSDSKVTSLVTQGSGEHVRQIPSAGDVLRKEQGDVVQYTAPSHFPFFHPNMPGFDDFLPSPWITSGTLGSTADIRCTLGVFRLSAAVRHGPVVTARPWSVLRSPDAPMRVSINCPVTSKT